MKRTDQLKNFLETCFGKMCPENVKYEILKWIFEISY